MSNVSNSRNTRVALVVGHNIKSRGASRKLNINGSKTDVTEYGFWAELLEETKGELDAVSGVDVKIFYRKYHGRWGYVSEMDDLHHRIDRWGADIDVECHFNASASSARGHEVLYHTNSRGGKLVAIIMDSAMDMHLSNRDRGRKPVSSGGRGSYGLGAGASRSLILEPFFAKELSSFIQGGKDRGALKKVLIQFLNNVISVNEQTAEPVRDKKDAVKLITHKRSVALTEKELAFVLEWLA